MCSVRRSEFGKSSLRGRGLAAGEGVGNVPGAHEEMIILARTREVMIQRSEDRMKKKVIGILAVFVLVLGVATMAGAVKGGDTVNYTVTGSDPTDSGTCGPPDWANDFMTRFYQVYSQQNIDGSYRVQQNFQNGTFTTIAGPSPESCEAGNNHMVLGGQTGNFKGQFIIKVLGGTFTPVASCPSPCYTATFVAAHFGGAATFEVSDFWFKYRARGNTFCNKLWINAATGNSGDIANTCTP
jgi:hypothetical protein